MSDEQAKLFAAAICTGVRGYIAAHRAEFEAWRREQEATKHE